MHGKDNFGMASGDFHLGSSAISWHVVVGAPHRKNVMQPIVVEAPMDWDENKAASSKNIMLGQDLTAFSVDELQQLVSALEVEIIRLRAEIETKKARSAAADQLFKR